MSEKALTQEGRGTCVCLSCRLARTYDILPLPLCKPFVRVYGGLEERARRRHRWVTPIIRS